MRWEYCAVVGLVRRSGQLTATRDPGAYYPAVWYFTTQGMLKQEIRGNEAIELGKAIAALGEQGWEMVGIAGMEVGSTSDSGIFFKRPKP